MFKKIGLLFVVLLAIISDVYSLSPEKTTNEKEIVYFAQRVARLSDPTLVLNLSADMTPTQVREMFFNKKIDRGSYIYNGVWLFSDRTQSIKIDFPAQLTSRDVVAMICEKVARSSVMVAKIAPKAYGTIAEIGMAVGRGNIAVYVFPDPEAHLTLEELKDLWFIFQMAASTSHLWKAEHFTCTPAMMPMKMTLEQYRAFIASFKAPFLK